MPRSERSFDFLDEVFRHAQNLNSALIERRWMRMAENPFHFFRGTTRTFYRYWARRNIPLGTPVIWVCGDAHWENVGSYRGKNRVAYFDLTDFDHSNLVPLELELARALTAYFVVGAARLARVFLSEYRATLLAGKPQHIEQEVAKGAVAQLLNEVANRRRKAFLRSWTKAGRIRVKDGQTFRLRRAERAEVVRIFRTWARARENAGFFKLCDVCGSLAGIGALGRRRYLVLVKGGNRPHLIDMKEGSPSALADLKGARPADWTCEAERIATVQNYIQYVPIAHLGWTKHRKLSFVLSDFQPTEDRVETANLPPEEYVSFAKKWGRLLAWAHLRGSGWKKGASADELIAYAQRFDRSAQLRLLKRGHDAGAVTLRAYREFVDLRNRAKASPSR